MDTRPATSAKIANSRNTLLRSARDTSVAESKAKLQQVAKRMAHTITAARSCTNLDSLRGIEGESANTYFSVFNHMIAPRVSRAVRVGRRWTESTPCSPFCTPC